jgi:hypothetical protein
LRRLRQLSLPQTLLFDEDYKWLCNWFADMPDDMLKAGVAHLPLRGSPEEVDSLVNLRRVLRVGDSEDPVVIRRQAEQLADVLANVLWKETHRVRLYRMFDGVISGFDRRGVVDR